MVAKRSIDTQIRALGLHFRMRGRGEVNELRNILQPGEQIKHCIYGYYSGGSGILVATSNRLLLIDKRPLYLYLEEFSYDTINESLVMQKLLQTTLFIRSGTKRIRFRSLSDARLKRMSRFVQARLAEIERDIRDSNVIVSEINKGLVPHPAWRPHAPHMIRQRPAKFHRSIGKVARV